MSTNNRDGNSDRRDENWYQRTFDPETDSVSEVLVETIVEVYDVDPAELDVLAEYLDPDALDALFRPRLDGTARESDTVARFTYDEYAVRVESDGTVAVRPSDEG